MLLFLMQIAILLAFIIIRYKQVSIATKGKMVLLR